MQSLMKLEIFIKYLADKALSFRVKYLRDLGAFGVKEIGLWKSKFGKKNSFYNSYFVQII